MLRPQTPSDFLPLVLTKRKMMPRETVIAFEDIA